jgi:hypothetical protein
MSDIDFSELETIPHEEIVERSANQERTIRTLDDEFNTLKDDRKEQIKIVKSLRAAIGGIEEANSERKGLLKEFHSIKKKADLCRKTRDEMNRLIPPPASVLEEWLAETYVKLTTIDNDLTTIPTLPRELDSFRRFFELQVAIVKKREAENAHQEYVKFVESIREITNKLDATRKIKKETVDAAAEESEINSDNVTRNEIRKMSKRISGIDKRLDKIKEERKMIRKNLGILRSYLKITSSRGKPIRLSDVKQRASKGGALNTTELSALLDSGRLTDISTLAATEETKSQKDQKIRTGKKQKRKLGVTRGGPRKGNSAAKRE